RPANSWILYRQEKHPIVLKQHAGITNNNISKIVAEWWKNEPEEIKRIYKSRAEEERRRHRLLHPDYKYAPRK
ncbi:high mobility group box domain-containing protein, partial [Fimicolochytrium jonesii]|uniref:high mobility group box domain-containing protein n=1 Tax=Fimicolochytrium jonesii TaxID=1396493 RepID=UPI0022FDB574